MCIIRKGQTLLYYLVLKSIFIYFQLIFFKHQLRQFFFLMYATLVLQGYFEFIYLYLTIYYLN